MIQKPRLSLGVLIVLALGLLFAVLLHYLPPAHGAEPQQRPYSCRVLAEEQRKCTVGPCNKRAIERLGKECRRDRRRAAERPA